MTRDESPAPQDKTETVHGETEVARESKARSGPGGPKAEQG